MSFWKTILLTGLLLTTGLIATAQAETTADPRIDNALSRKDYATLQAILTEGPNAIDEVVKALLKSVQQTMHSEPDQAQKKISLAGDYAEQITPPTVPAVCADMRRIAEAMTPDQVGTPLYEAIVMAAESFANAPVVVAAGRPNFCEEAWLQIATLEGDPLLAQTPNKPPRCCVPPPPPRPTSPD